MVISVGGEFFDEIRQDGSYYVDKTEILYELVKKTKNKVTLFTRPRRFGKTLMLSMMESFFDIRRDSRQNFEGLAVTRNEDFCREYMNQYPVIFISFKDVEGLDFKTAYGKLKIVVADLCKKHSYLLDDDRINSDDIETFKKLNEKGTDSAVLQSSLKIIMRMMCVHFGKPVILLIDEYDVPLDKANQNGYYREMLDVIRGVLSTSLKTNEFLKFAIVTGCLRISKESIFTGVNNFAAYPASKKRFSRYFGFTEEEVNEMLKAAELSERADIIREWYDGYLFGTTRVYCPWDVVSFLNDSMDDPETEPQNYWLDSSGNGIVRAFVEQTNFDVKSKFEALLNGGSITETVTEELTYDQLYDMESHLWSVLLMTGYLTRSKVESLKEPQELRIPNKEISGIFQKAVVNHFTASLNQSDFQKLMSVLWDGDTNSATDIISNFLWETISYHDYHEDYYHAFLTGLFSGRGMDVESNKEHGKGRPDILLRDNRMRRALIIEAKKANSEEEMEAECENALKQIDKEKYFKGLRGFKEIRCYGVAFFEKTALVKELKS